MSIFFGKISANANQEFNDIQINKKRYYADKGSGWFGTIQINDYCYILSGDNIYFWQALEWGNDKEGDYLQFKDILNGKLPIKGNKFRSLNIFKFNSDLMVLTIRKVRNKAFFELEFSKEINIDDLKKVSFYNNESNYRRVIVVNSKYNDFNDNDIYLLKDEDKVSLYRSSFFDDDVYSQFNDNLKFLNGNKRNKNTTLAKIFNADSNSEFTSEQLTLNSLYDAFFVEYDKDILNDDKDNKENTEMPNNDKQTQPLNQILYGPPGTGKTYNIINKALKILEGIVPQGRDKAKVKFEAYKKAGQIEFVTFHQSYGYEEFVEGIKAKTTDKGIEYEIEPGIFKKLCLSPRKSKIYKRQYPESMYRELTITEYLKLEDKSNIQDGDYIVIQNEHGKALEILIATSPYSEDFKVNISKIKIKDNMNILLNTIGSPYFKEIDDGEYEKVHKFIKQNVNKILIIDEINRGNISKIFGELITLIEPSKRIGADEEIKVKLPYSNDDFGVPSNLYIIGTMNTADRSIALMDTALRRRFDFTEMMPDLAVLTSEENKDNSSSEKELNGDLKVNSSINIRLLLRKINQRVEYLYDRDHTIGHAYFMSLKDNPSLDELESIFKNKIIPLLQEYFYDDWEKIRLVLGDNQKEENYQFIKIKKDYDISKLFGSNISDTDIDDEQKVYEINKDTFKKSESYKKVYETK